MSTLRYIIMQMLKEKVEETMLKAEKHYCHIQGNARKANSELTKKKQKVKNNGMINSKCYKETKMLTKYYTFSKIILQANVAAQWDKLLIVTLASYIRALV